MIKRILTAAASAALALSVLTGCLAPYVSPCTRLPAPTAQEIEIANTGADVEREIDNVECDLINGAWVEEDEDTSYGSAPKTKTKATAARATPKKKP